MEHLKRALLLSDLPAEIIDEVLSYALPDFATSGWVDHATVVAMVFTHPLLQSNKILRKRGLGLIHKNTVWIHIDPLNEDVERIVNELQLPWLSKKWQHLIRPDAAKLQLCYGNTSATDFKATHANPSDTDKFIFPFSFDRLVYLLAHMTYLAEDSKHCKLVVGSHDLTSHSRRIIHDLILPPLSTVQWLTEFAIEKEGLRLSPDGVELFATYPPEDYSLAGFTARMRDILIRDNRLRQLGYHDEADLLCFSSLWVLDSADAILPLARDWMGIDEEDLDHYDSARPGCSLVGNQLRSYVHKIECRARVSFARFVDKYGRKWFLTHRWLLEAARERFQTSDTAWFGLTVLESIELYYARAVSRKALSNIVFKASIDEQPGPDWRAMQYRQLREAATNMMFAWVFAPANELFRKKYQEYSQLLDAWDQGGEHQAWLDTRRMVVVRDNSDPTLINRLKPVVWFGDHRTLAEWGGAEVLWNLRVAQRGSFHQSIPFAEWGATLNLQNNTGEEATDDLFRMIGILKYPTPQDLEDENFVDETGHVQRPQM